MMQQVLPFLKFSIVGALRRRLLRSILSVILFSLGVSFAPAWANSARVVGVKMSAEEKALNEKSSPLSAVDAGDLVISNLTNVLEVDSLPHLIAMIYTLIRFFVCFY
jgi:hypothetical protein